MNCQRFHFWRNRTVNCCFLVWKEYLSRMKFGGRFIENRLVHIIPRKKGMASSHELEASAPWELTVLLRSVSISWGQRSSIDHPLGNGSEFQDTSVRPWTLQWNGLPGWPRLDTETESRSSSRGTSHPAGQRLPMPRKIQPRLCLAIRRRAPISGMEFFYPGVACTRGDLRPPGYCIASTASGRFSFEVIFGTAFWKWNDYLPRRISPLGFLQPFVKQPLPFSMVRLFMAVVEKVENPAKDGIDARPLRIRSYSGLQKRIKTSLMVMMAAAPRFATLCLRAYVLPFIFSIPLPDGIVLLSVFFVLSVSLSRLSGPDSVKSFP